MNAHKDGDEKVPFYLLAVILHRSPDVLGGSTQIWHLAPQNLEAVLSKDS